MCLFSFSLGVREQRPLPRDTPHHGSERSSKRLAVASPSESREPVGSAGKEAIVAPCGVVENAASAR
jgi:hypothetical protein